MKVLLDTHTVLWSMNEPSLLSDAARTLLLDNTTEVLISAVTPWELSIKHHNGKLPEAAPLLADFPLVITSLAAIFLPIGLSHTILSGRLQWTHRDPFDRMLAAQAMTEGATLVSRDKVFDTLPGLQRLW